MVRENIMFFENDYKSCTVIDLYLNHNIFFGYKDSYTQMYLILYDIDVDKILLFKKGDNEYIIRYNYVNKMTIAPCSMSTKKENNNIPRFLSSFLFLQTGFVLLNLNLF